MPLWLGILLAVLSAFFAFLAGVQFGSAQRRVDRILAEETRRPRLNDEAASDEGEARDG